MLLPRHSAKRPFSYFLENSFAECYNLDTVPSASRVALGKVTNFPECRPDSTRQSVKLRRVPTWQHSANFESLPSATRLALGKVPVPRPIRPSRWCRSPVPFPLFLPSAIWHTAKVCRVLEIRHSAKPASTGDETPCALCHELH